MADLIRIENSSINKKLDIDFEEHIVHLELPNDKELNSAVFKIIIDEDKKKINSEISSLYGMINLPVKSISWIVADFKKEVNIDSISLFFPMEENALKLRIKIFTNEAWTPLMPIDVFSVSGSKTNLNFTPVMASKLMIEFIRERDKIAGLLESVAVGLNGLEFFSPLSDLNLSIGENEIFGFKGLIKKGKEYTFDNFVPAVNSYLHGKPVTKIIPLKYTARGSGIISFIISEIVFAEVISKFSNQINCVEIEVDYGERKKIEIDVKSNSKIDEVKFDFKTDFLREEVSDHKSGSKNYLLCDKEHCAARVFNIEDDRFIGVDLLVRAAKVPIECSLNLFKNEFNSPSDVSIGEMAFKTDKKSEFCWISFRFDKQEIEPCKVWAVFKVKSGEIHWYLGERKEKEELTMIQIKSHPWQPLDEYIGIMRTASEILSNQEVKFSISQGKKSIDLIHKNGTVDHKNFQELHDEKEEKAEFFVQSRGKGKILINNLKIKIK